MTVSMTRLDDELTKVVLYAMQNDLLLAAKWISGRQSREEKATRPKRRRKVRLGKEGRTVTAGDFYIEPAMLEDKV